MDPAVELSLLQARFPDVQISDYGKLLFDCFCARHVEAHTYEGRIFLTEKSMLFVSAYYNARCYDVIIPFADVRKVTAIQRSIIPSVEISLGDREEHFTNFYNLERVMTALKKVLPQNSISEIKQSTSLKRLNRLTSVPASTYYTSPPFSPPGPKVDPCPFFAKSGFCPRQPLCTLDHTLHTPGHQRRSQKPTIPINPSSAPKRREHFTKHLGSPKRFRASEGISENDTSNLAFMTNELVKEVEKLHAFVNDIPDYTRSLSSPAASLFRKTAAVTRKEEENGSVGEHSQAEGDGSLLADANQQITNLDHIGQSTNGEDSSRDPPVNTPPPEFESPLEIPKTFNFSKLARQHSDSCHSSPEKTTEQDGVVPVSPKTDSVFVFTATDPDYVSPPAIKRKNAAVGFRLPPISPKKDHEEGSDEIALLLAQQLELGGTSDNDSLQGDLDVDYQRKLLETFGGNSPTERKPSDSATSGESEGERHKKHPCTFFLSGYCRNGTECPDYHGLDHQMESDEELPEYDEHVTFPSKLAVCFAASGGRKDIDSGDKIILSPQILIACEQKQLSYPMAFKLEHPSSGKVVHTGVLEFTSPSPNAAYLPQWMMEHLHAEDGDEVSFEHVYLPKGTFVRLQPVSSAWLGIPYDKRLAMMEFQLRNFQTLTEGTKVTLTYELNRYTLKVLECKPAKGISILDADITTDIVEPADFSRFHSVEEGQAEHIGLDEPVKCSIPPNSYRHFVLLSLPGQPLPSRLRVEVKGEKGDPDLFLSQTCTAPSQRRYTWFNQDVGDSVYYLSTDEKDYDINKPLYTGVVSLCEDTDFTICFHREDTLAAAKARPSSLQSGQTLRTTGTDHTDSDTSSSLPLPPGQERCSYCSSVMPSLRLLMHERHCAQSTFKCPLCKACLPKAAEKKHRYIAHEPLMCECGQEFIQLALHHHQLTDCMKRSVQCSFKWCNLSFPMDQLQHHEHLCGRKRVPCDICKEEVSQLELEMHLQAFHSVDVENIDWTKPLANQILSFKSSEPKFKCVCGSGFEFQDDMEVHQLTECPTRRMAEGVSPQPPEESMSPQHLTECPTRRMAEDVSPQPPEESTSPQHLTECPTRRMAEDVSPQPPEESTSPQHLTEYPTRRMAEDVSPQPPEESTSPQHLTECPTRRMAEGVSPQPPEESMCPTRRMAEEVSPQPPEESMSPQDLTECPTRRMAEEVSPQPPEESMSPQDLSIAEGELVG